MNFFSLIRKAAVAAGIAVLGASGAQAATQYDVEINELTVGTSTTTYANVPISLSFVLQDSFTLGDSGDASELGLVLNLPNGGVDLADFRFNSSNLFSFGPQITIRNDQGDQGVFASFRIGLDGTSSEGSLFALVQDGGFFNTNGVDPSTFSVTTTDVDPIPLPGAALLFAGGLAAFARLRRA